MEEQQMAEGQAAAGHQAGVNLAQMSWEGAGDSVRLHPTELQWVRRHTQLLN